MIKLVCNNKSSFTVIRSAMKLNQLLLLELIIVLIILIQLKY
jgi:hypothetical protein